MQEHKQTILIIEDDEPARKCMAAFLEQKGFAVLEGKNGRAGLEVLEEENPDLLLLDMSLSGIDGIEILKTLAQNLSELPVIITSGAGTLEDAVKSLQSGAWDFLDNPSGNTEALLHSVNRALQRRNLILEHKKYREHLESEVKKRTEKLKLSEQSLKESLIGTINVVASVVEMRDPYTADHQRRVADLAVRIADALGFDEHRREGLLQAASIHDLGKVAVPIEILAKPGWLSDLEYGLVRTHVQVGYKILTKNDVRFPWPIAQIVQQHHERFNGSGYPFGLTGDEILPEAQILAVADVVEAMASHRPYRHALGIEVALNEIRINSGRFYAPSVVDACLHVFRNERYEFIRSPNYDIFSSVI